MPKGVKATVRSDGFFIGWSNSFPPGLRRFVLLIALVLVPGLGLLGLGLSAGADDPADALLRIGERVGQNAPVRPEEWAGDQVFRGHLETRGHSVLHVAPDASYPRGRVILLSGDGKRGPVTNGHQGAAEVRGGLIRRGSIEMLVVDIKPLDGNNASNFGPLPRESLGRWRIAGEICDGKCYPGGMRPGNGLSHKACAVLCLYGEVPPIFVTVAPVDGRSFLVIVGPDGQSPYRHISNVIAIPVELEGEVERVGNVLVFRIDPARVRRL
jgi:hypothetical protein